MGAYIVFNHPLSLHRCMEDFSAVTMFKYPKELKFQEMHKLKVWNICTRVSLIDYTLFLSLYTHIRPLTIVQSPSPRESTQRVNCL